MRIWTALIVCVVALGILPSGMSAAHAQSVFQKIFGLGAPPNAVMAPPPRARFVVPPRRYQSRPSAPSSQSRARPGDSEEEEIGPPDSAGPFKTVCVRACDGFYFPVRNNARRKNFASDVRSCRNACGTDARLFYHPMNAAEGADAMVDLSGRKYADLPKAFAYRKALIDGCACKPDPWSYETAARHQSYADQEAIERAKDDAFVRARAAKAEALQATPPSDSGDEAHVTPDLDGSINMTAAVQQAITPSAGFVPSAAAGQVIPVTDEVEPAEFKRAPRRRGRRYFHKASFKPSLL